MKKFIKFIKNLSDGGLAEDMYAAMERILDEDTNKETMVNKQQFMAKVKRWLELETNWGQEWDAEGRNPDYGKIDGDHRQYAGRKVQAQAAQHHQRHHRHIDQHVAAIGKRLLGNRNGILPQNQAAAQDLNQGRDLTEEESRKHRRHCRLQQFRCGHKSRGEILQTPAENTVAENGREDCQQQTDNQCADIIRKQVIALYCTHTYQYGCAGNVNNVCIRCGGNGFTNDAAD